MMWKLKIGDLLEYKSTLIKSIIKFDCSQMKHILFSKTKIPWDFLLFFFFPLLYAVTLPILKCRVTLDPEFFE